jgi:hypothetical protein
MLLARITQNLFATKIGTKQADIAAQQVVGH